MPEWATFVGFTFVVTSGLLVLSHASRGAIADGSETASQPPSSEVDVHRQESVGADRQESADADCAASDPDAAYPTGRSTIVDGADASGATAGMAAGDTDHEPEPAVRPEPAVGSRPSEQRAQPPSKNGDPTGLPTTSLLANVAVSQGLFGALLLVGAWYAAVPAWAFGAGPGTTGLRAVAVGVGLGIALYVANEAGAALGSRLGFEIGDGQRLRGALAPDTSVEWVLLLVVVLPVIAGFEELLFRGALVGVVAAGYPVSPWVMAVVASGAFALGHGAQGRLGVAVTGALGFVLAAACVVTGSLLGVIVAHYLVNVLEFVVHEGLGVEWPLDDAV